MSFIIRGVLSRRRAKWRHLSFTLESESGPTKMTLGPPRWAFKQPCQLKACVVHSVPGVGLPKTIETTSALLHGPMAGYGRGRGGASGEPRPAVAAAAASENEPVPHNGGGQSAASPVVASCSHHSADGASYRLSELLVMICISQKAVTVDQFKDHTSDAGNGHTNSTRAAK